MTKNHIRQVTNVSCNLIQMTSFLFYNNHEIQKKYYFLTPKMSRIPFTIHAKFRLDGLAGGDYEYTPLLSHYGTYDDHGIVKKTNLALDHNEEIQLVIKGYSLRKLADIDANERVVMHIITKSNHSGVKALDMLRFNRRPISMRSGQMMLPLRDIVESALTKEPISKALDNPLLMRQLLGEALEEHAKSKSNIPVTSEIRHEYIVDSIRKATKGSVIIRSEFDPSVSQKTLKTYLRTIDAKIAAGEEENGPLVIDTERFYRLSSYAMNDIHLSEYLKAFGEPFHEDIAKYPVTKNAKLEDLVLVTDRQDFGDRLPVCFFQSRAPNKRTGVYAGTAEDARFANAMVTSSLVHFNMSPTVFEAAVKSIGEDGTQMNHDILKSCCALAVYGTLPANSVEYASDESIPHKKYLHDMQPITVKPLTLATAEKAEETGDPNIKPLEIFDHGTRTGEMDTDDCDGEDATCTSIYDVMPDIAKAGDPIETSHLQHMSKLREYYEICDVGALATASYPDTEGKSSAELRNFELPKRFEQRDLDANISGHCHAMAIPSVKIERMIANGGLNGKDFILRGRIPKPVEFQLPTQILEPTGPVSSLVLSAEEYGPQYQSEFRAVRELKHAMVESCPTLLSTHRMTGTAFYEKKQDPERRVSMFYREVLHLIVPRLYEHNPQMAQFQVVDMRTGKRGVDYGTLLRDDGTNIALVSHLANVPREKLDRELVPIMNTLSNLLPATTLLRTQSANVPPMETAVVMKQDQMSFATQVSAQVEFRDLETMSPMPMFNQAMGRVGHLMSESTVISLSQYRNVDARLIDESMERHSIGMQKRNLTLQGLVLAVADRFEVTEEHEARRIIRENIDRKDRTVLTLHSQSWRLASADTTSMAKELASLKQRKLISGYVFWSDQPIAQCSDVVTLALFVPIL